MRLFTVVVAALALAGAAGADTIVSFRTPTGNIGCVFASGLGPTNLRCDIRSRLRPQPSRPHGCNLDWGDSYTLGVRGRAVLTCHGDTAIVPDSRVLKYGARWTRSGFACDSRFTGLTCRNGSGHGFFLSRARSYRFQRTSKSSSAVSTIASGSSASSFGRSWMRPHVTAIACMPAALAARTSNGESPT